MTPERIDPREKCLAAIARALDEFAASLTLGPARGGRRPAVSAREVMRLKRQGVSVVGIAAQLGVSRQTIHRTIKEASGKA